MRRFMRHPADIPVACRREGRRQQSESELRNISFGGLAFVSDECYCEGDIVHIEFPSLPVHTRIRGEIVWCERIEDSDNGQYVSGLRFLEKSEHFRARLVEQICHIESYRLAQRRAGRDLSPHVAAEEWISRNADKFP